jgi:hypothetical protein
MSPASPPAGAQPARPVPDLFALLPSVHRTEDIGQGGPLQAILDVLAWQADLVRRDVAGLYDDLFVDTCADWAVPYLGDLVGARPLHDVDQSRRRDVAHTIRYRRRKGVLAMLEELAGDVTGWSVHAVAEYERLAWSQHLEHVRSHGPPATWSVRADPAASLVGAAEVRDADLMDRVGGPFDATARTVDLRHARQGRARPHVRNVTFHARPHKPLRVDRVLVHHVDASEIPHGHPHFGRAYRIGHLGADFPLFSQAHLPPGVEPAPGQPPFEPAAPIRPLALHLDLERARRSHLLGEAARSAYVSEGKGPGLSLQFWHGGHPVPAHQVQVMDLSDWGVAQVEGPGGQPADASRVPTSVRYMDGHGERLRGPRQPDGDPGRVLPVLEADLAVDPRTGRVVQRDAGRRMRVTFHRGVSALLGGGNYARELAAPPGRHFRATVPHSHRQLGPALDAWEAGPEPDGLIELDTNGVRDAATSIQLAPGRDLVVRAANLRWPHLRAPIHIHGAPGARLTLDGLCIQDRLVIRGEVELRLRHCALVPGWRLHGDGTPRFPHMPSIQPVGGIHLDLTLDHCVTGPLRLPAEAATVRANDSVLQAPELLPGEPAIAYGDPDDKHPGPGPALRLERCTVLGAVHARTLEASETLFADQVQVERRQEGCIRFSHVPTGSLTPRRFRCEPDLTLEALGAAATDAAKALAAARIAPVFLSRRYGHPDYGRLRPDADPAVREGAEGGGEMGAHGMLRDPHREQNLDARMAEYLPLGRRHTLEIHEARP